LVVPLQVLLDTFIQAVAEYVIAEEEVEMEKVGHGQISSGPDRNDTSSHYRTDKQTMARLLVFISLATAHLRKSHALKQAGTLKTNHRHPWTPRFKGCCSMTRSSLI
jgi:hypothetical protein